MTNVAIIGGGLAGAACGYVLKQAGLDPVIYEAGAALAGGASGNALGLYNPRLSAERTPQAEYYISAFNAACKMFETLDDVDWNPCGALHLITDEKREIRYTKMFHNWGWSEKRMRMVGAEEASEISGVDVAYDALYLPESGLVSPQKLCEALACGVEVVLNTRVENIADIEADAIIIANGAAALNFEETKMLGLQSVRGQITYVAQSAPSSGLKAALCYGGYIAPAVDGQHIVGATFQPWLSHSDIIEQDDYDNLLRLAEFVPALSSGFEIEGQRASVRTASKDRFPVVGSVPEHDGVYISTAHGSHGIISSIEAARVIADLILERPPALPHATIERLSPARYYRANK